jgi:chitinase
MSVEAKGAPVTTNSVEGKPIVLGYYPSWPTGTNPAAIRYELFTHLCHAFVEATTEGLVRVSGNLPSRELVDQAHTADVKVLVSVGGADSGTYLGDVATDALRRRRFVHELVNLVENSGYDGVDLDWEFPRTAAERDALTTLARELRRALGGGKLLVSAQSGTPWGARFVDGEALRSVLDWVAVMTYDAHGPWSAHAGHNAPMRRPAGDEVACTSNTVEAQMQRWQEWGGWPAGRLLVGIPCYGRGFPVPLHARLPKARGRYRWEYVAFRDIGRLLAEDWKIHWDNEAQVPWLESPDGTQCFSYDDRESAKRKGEWARRHGYGGIFFWEISQDVVGGRNGIVESARAGYLGKPRAD